MTLRNSHTGSHAITRRTTQLSLIVGRWGDGRSLPAARKLWSAADAYLRGLTGFAGSSVPISSSFVVSFASSAFTPFSSVFSSSI